MLLAPVPGQSFDVLADHSHRRREHPFPRSPRRRARAGHGVVSRHEGIDGAARRRGSRGRRKLPDALVGDMPNSRASSCRATCWRVCRTRRLPPTSRTLPSRRHNVAPCEPRASRVGRFTRGQHQGSGHSPMVPSPSPQPIEILTGIRGCRIAAATKSDGT
jgi:hypothetical protein